jgi:hypothetical protein
MRSSRVENDLLVSVSNLEVDLIARLQPSAIPQRLGDHNLPLRPDSANHTSEV